MKKTLSAYWPLFLIAAVMLLVTCNPSLAQDGPAGIGGAAATVPTEALTAKQQMLMAAVTLLAPLLIAVLKNFLNQNFMARWKHWIPVLAPVVGELLNLVASLFGLPALPTGGGAMAGLMGVGVREAVDQRLRVMEKKFENSIGMLALAGLGAALMLSNGCALGSYQSVEITGTNQVKTTYKTLTWYRDEKLKGLKIGHTTKTTKTGLAIGSNESDTDEAAIDATANIVEAAVRGAVKGVVPK